MNEVDVGRSDLLYAEDKRTAPTRKVTVSIPRTRPQKLARLLYVAYGQNDVVFAFDFQGSKRRPGGRNSGPSSIDLISF